MNNGSGNCEYLPSRGAPSVGDTRPIPLTIGGNVAIGETGSDGNLPTKLGAGLSPDTSKVGTQTGQRNSTKYTTSGTKLVVTATKGTVLGCMIDGGDAGVTVELFAAITAINSIDSISVPIGETRMLAFDGLAYTTGLVAVITSTGTVDVSIRWVTG